MCEFPPGNSRPSFQVLDVTSSACACPKQGFWRFWLQAGKELAGKARRLAGDLAPAAARPDPKVGLRTLKSVSVVVFGGIWSYWSGVGDRLRSGRFSFAVSANNRNLFKPAHSNHSNPYQTFHQAMCPAIDEVDELLIRAIRSIPSQALLPALEKLGGRLISAFPAS